MNGERRQLKLFCIPYAGGSATYYLKWRRHLDQDIKLVPLELSGRGARFEEPLHRNFQDAVDDLYNHLLRELDTEEPYAIFGHSMGALFGFELYQKLHFNQKALPRHMFFSGKQAPHINLFMTRREKIHGLPDEQLLEKLKEYNGVTQEFLNNHELIKMFLPVIRADFRMVETYQFIADRYRMNCPITILNGSHDYMTEEEVKAWEMHTTNTCAVISFKGGHFFIDEHLSQVIHIIHSSIKVEH
ncbi:thioesterase II family protein [Paenibacillus sp. UASWS1643]|uniref:thioesterase II family protein n=1 Tax=Paenibacillus sp. UASWS1643 TaxID=2580422 RepID=UPI001CC309D8|nr:thioesterase domain-containing protein [Paenibacillus sp. UASWS1643]